MNLSPGLAGASRPERFMEVLIEFEKKPRRFTNPRKVIVCRRLSEIPRALAEIEEQLDQGFYAAGFLSHEAGYAFEEQLRNKKRYDFPLLLFGIYDGFEAQGLAAKQGEEVQRAPGKHSQDDPFFSLENLRPNIGQADYAKNIGRIRNYIARGEVYQITYCLKLKFDFRGSGRALYQRLYREQPVPYPAYLETDEFQILSLSPERFIKKTGTRALTEPMKGTWPRGQDRAADQKARRLFAADQKNRAENVMIADLLRNDLGRIGTNIDAPKLFKIAKYRTLYQMTSIVTGRVPKDLPAARLLAALFPSGSVTGAPKIRAMEIIREIEKEERKIYTGAIGWIAPNRDLYFNIPIRTLLVSRGKAEMGIGGGIVWDSTAQGEWEEGLLKARFLTGLAEAARDLQANQIK